MSCSQWCSGSAAPGAIAPVPILQGGAPLQFLVHLFLVNFAYILQIVQIGDTHLDSCSIKCGVPQGSILGPLLFLIYVNDMRAAVSCKLLLYADDSALLTSGKDVSEIEGVLSRELESLSEWLEENRLSLHLGKTQSILFGSKKRLRTSNKLHVVCNGSDIEPDVEVTYLGVNLDQSLSGSSIVNKIVTKCNNKIKFLYRNARSFDPQTNCRSQLPVSLAS